MSGPASRLVRVGAAVALLVVTVAPVPSRAAAAACDLFSRPSFFDELGVTDITDTDPLTNETDIGMVGTLSIESGARQPGTGILFAADFDQLGTVDTATAAFSPAPSTLGSGNGALGLRSFADARGLAFDPATGDLYAVLVSSEPELLIRVDPVGGAAVPNAFGPGQDYLALTLGAPYGAADTLGEIANYAGAWYGLVDHAGGTDLASLDLGTGSATKIATIGPDVTGLDFDDGGQAWALTGDGTLSKLNVATAGLTESRTVDNSSNYRGLACIGAAGGNTPPVANPDPVGTPEDTAVVVTPLGNDSDADGDPLTIDSFTQPANGTVVDLGGGSLRYTPDQHWNGVDSFDYTVTDGNSGFDSATVTVTVSAVPDQPEVQTTPDHNVAEGDPYTLTITATDPDGDPLTLSAVGLPAWVSFVDNGDGTADLSGTPGYTDAAVSTVTVTADDGGLTGQDTFDLTVTNTVGTPSVLPPGDQTVAEGYAFSLTVAATDPESDPLTLSAVGLPAWVTFVDNGDGTADLTGTPGYTDAAVSTVTVTADDGGLTGQDTFDLTVTGHPATDPPPAPAAGPPQQHTADATPAPPEDDGGAAEVLVPDESTTGSAGDLETGSSAPKAAPLVGSPAGELVTEPAVAGRGTAQPTPAESAPPLPRVTMPDDSTATGEPRHTPAANRSSVPSLNPDLTLTAVRAALPVQTIAPTASLQGAPLISPREGLMVAFRAAVETLRDHALAAVILGIFIAWLSVKALDRNREEPGRTVTARR